LYGSTRIAAAAFLACASLLLLPQAARADDGDAIAPGVGRISVVHGEVDIQRGDSGDVVAASINAPLQPGDYLTTGADGRTEVQTESGGIVRLAAATQTRVPDLEGSRQTFQLAQGTVEADALSPQSARPVIETPSVSVQMNGRGAVRVTVTDDGNTLVTVRAGSAQIRWQGASQRAEAGSTFYLSGSGGNVVVSPGDPVALDAFDRFNSDRDDYIRRSISLNYANPGIVGASDLDGYGRWVYVANYGEVWAPAVQTGWAPYQAGHWVWQPYYGWTWVSYEPWGWAPYHYGRWFYSQAVGWAWYPGPIVARPVYAPALVGFIGFSGGNVNVSIGFGNIGWVPLAPYEPYHPWWGHGYTNNINRTVVVNNVTNVNVTNNYNNVTVNHYANINAPGAVSAVNSNNFGTHRAVLMTVKPSEIVGAKPIVGAVPIVPSRASLQYSDRTPAPSAARVVSPHFEKFTTPVRTPAPFTAQQQTVRRVTAVTPPPAAIPAATPTPRVYAPPTRVFTPQPQPRSYTTPPHAYTPPPHVYTPRPARTPHAAPKAQQTPHEHGNPQ
jgi:hypothetical protein